MTASATVGVCPDLCAPLYGAARDLLQIQSIAALRQAVPLRAAQLLGCTDCCLTTPGTDMAGLQVVSVAGAPPPLALLHAVAERLSASPGDATPADAFLLSNCCPEVKTAIVAWMSSDGAASGLLIASEGPAATGGLSLEKVRYLAFFASLAADAMHKAEIFERLERHSELLRLGAYVSTAFVGLAREGGRAAIGTLLRQIGDFAGVDRAYLFLISEDGERMSNTHEWCAVGVEPMIDLLQEIPVDTMAWAMERIRTQDVLHIPRVSDLPGEASAVRDILEMQSIQSLVIVPLRADQHVFGFMGFDATSPTHSWSEHDIALLRMIGEVIVNALRRWNTEDELHRRDVELANINQKLEDRIVERTEQLLKAKANLETVNQQLAFHSHILNAVQDGILAVDNGGKVIYWNPGAEALLGYPASAMLGTNMMPRLADKWRVEAANEFLPLLRQDQSWSGEFDFTRADGTSFPGMVTLSPMHDATGLQAVIVSIKDVSALRWAERSLRENEQRLELALHGAELGTWDWYVGSDAVVVNERWLEMLGASDQSQGLAFDDWYRRLHPDDLATVMRALQDHMEGRTASYVSEHRLLRNDGNYIWVLDAGKVIERNEAGRPLRACGTHMDISKRKDAEEAQRASEERFRIIAENTVDLITIIDVDSSLLYISPSVRRFGYEPEALQGRTYLELVHPEERRGLEASIAQMVESMMPYVVNSYRIRNRAGQYQWVESTTNPVRMADGRLTGLLSVTHDVTLRVQTEAKLRSALEAEREVAEIRTRMIGVASHEFRTPLAGILAVTETLSAYRARLSDQQIEERLQTIRHQVNHLTRITEDVLNLSRLQGQNAQPKPEVIQLEALCEQLVFEHAQRAGRTREMLFFNNAGVVELYSDPALLNMVLGNLLENAVKYSPGGTPVRLELATVADSAVVRVVDQGIGIPIDDQARLFVPFFRASNVGTTQGTGLGLPIAHEAVNRLGGEITVQSEGGRGSTFVVTLPRRIPQHPHRQAVAQDAGRPT